MAGDHHARGDIYEAVAGPKMRIGEILLLHELVDPFVLRQTLGAATTGAKQRLVSLLISRAQLDPDAGAMALSEQSGYPAALLRHLERRDPRCQDVIPHPLVRRWLVLPLARGRDNKVVVAARDPTPILAAALAHASKQEISLAITPGIHLERMIKAIYGEEPSEEPAAEPSPPTIADIGDIEIDLDDLAPPQATTRPRTVSGMFMNASVPEAAAQSSDRISTILVDIDNARTLAAAERVALDYLERRWTAGLVMTVRDRRAIARKGHGTRIGESVLEHLALPLDAASTVQVAVDSAAATGASPEGPLQQRLHELLDGASAIAAAPILVRGQVHEVLVVGEPYHGTPRESLSDLARLADALSAATERLGRG